MTDFDWTLFFNIFAPDHFQDVLNETYKKFGRVQFESICLIPMLRNPADLESLPKLPNNVTLRPLKYEEESTKKLIKDWLCAGKHDYQYQQYLSEHDLCFAILLLWKTSTPLQRNSLSL